MKSSVTEHVWENHHPIHWEEMTVQDHGRRQELLVKEALHNQMTLCLEEWCNQDEGPGCWIAEMRRQGGRSNSYRPLTFNNMCLHYCMAINTSVCSHFTFTLMMTGGFS